MTYLYLSFTPTLHQSFHFPPSFSPKSWGIHIWRAQNTHRRFSCRFIATSCPIVSMKLTSFDSAEDPYPHACLTSSYFLFCQVWFGFVEFFPCSFAWLPWSFPLLFHDSNSQVFHFRILISGSSLYYYLHSFGDLCNLLKDCMHFACYFCWHFCQPMVRVHFLRNFSSKSQYICQLVRS